MLLAPLNLVYIRIFNSLRPILILATPPMSKCLFMSCKQNVGQTRNIKVFNKSFENIEVQILGNDINKLNLDP
jgi:hypothetical protein